MSHTYGYNRMNVAFIRLKVAAEMGLPPGIRDPGGRSWCSIGLDDLDENQVEGVLHRLGVVDRH